MLTEGEDRACDDEAAEWATGQVVRLVALYAAPVGIGVLGLWSLALAALASQAAWRLYRGVLTRDWEGPQEPQAAAPAPPPDPGSQPTGWRARRPA